MGLSNAQADLTLGPMLETKLSELDINKDGRPDVFRKWNKNGQLEHMVILVPFSSAQEIWTMEFKGNQRITTLTKNKKEVQRRVETHGNHGNLIEILVSNSDGTTIRETIEPHHRRTETFQSGKLVSTRLSPKSLRDVTEELARLDRRSEYVECLFNKSQIDPSECISFIETISLEKSLGMRDFSDLAHLRCERDTEDGPQLMLPSGMRIDLGTCKNPKQVEAIENAINDMAGAKLTCLTSLNPKLGLKFAANIAMKAPLFRCVGSEHGRKTAVDDLCPVGQFKQDWEMKNCRNFWISFLRSGGAAYIHERPRNIYLMDHDPSSDYKVDLRLSETLLHELLHSAGLDGGEGHDEGYPDDVYSCSSMCSEKEKLKKYASQEGCAACLKSQGNPVSDKEVLARCGQYMTDAEFKILRPLRDLARGLRDCKPGAKDYLCEELQMDRFQMLYCPSFPKSKCTPEKMRPYAVKAWLKFKARDSYNPDKLFFRPEEMESQLGLVIDSLELKK